jgi:hypothetical protein
MLAPLALVYLIWFLAAARSSYRTNHTLGGALRQLPQWTWRGLDTASSNFVGVRIIGPILLVLVCIWTIRRASSLVHTYAAAAVMGLAGAVLFFLISGVGPDAVHPAGAALNRYAYVAIALALPAVGLALTALIRHSRVRLLLVLGLLVVVGVANFNQLLSRRDFLTGQSQDIEQQVVAAARIADTEKTVPELPLADLKAPDLFFNVLVDFSRHGKLPTGVHPSARAVVDAATAIQLGVTTRPLFGRAAIDRRSGTPGALVPIGSTTCRLAVMRPLSSPQVLTAVQPSTLLLSRPGPGSLDARLTLGHVTGGLRGLEIGPHYRYLNLAAAPAILRLQLPSGTAAATCGS